MRNVGARRWEVRFWFLNRAMFKRIFTLQGNSSVESMLGGVYRVGVIVIFWFLTDVTHAVNGSSVAVNFKSHPELTFVRRG